MKIWEFFENLNEYVYVTDMDTYELIYMNKKTRETYGFYSLEEIVGKKCYEVLQGSSTPCTICNNHELQRGYFKEWRYYNPLLDKHFALKDTIIEDGGRRYRIELAIDASAQEWQSNMISNYQKLETLANEGLRIALQAPTPDKSIEVTLEYLGKALKGERTYVFEKNESGGDDNTYEWVANGVTPEKDNLQNLPPEVCANWYQNFGEEKNIIIEDLEDIREEDPLQYENLKRQDIHSLVVVPLYDDRKIIGFYGVDNPPGKSLEYASNMLQIMGHFIISSLKRRNLVQELQKMSYCDQLTKIGNRHAMSEYINGIQDTEGIGVVYCDITGLKQVNDTEGHEAGDRLILRACECLKTVFDGYGLFRIGGDELLALCPQIEEEKLKKKIGELKKNMGENAVTMAVGAAWQKECKENIGRLISEAEKQMYKDKALYYKNLGVDRRSRKIYT
ncbi:MAG: diguanylate cyclase domain-containing protein [Lachnospiraceae bacterium]